MNAGIMGKIQKFICKESPTILACMGAVGTVCGVVLSTSAALKSKDRIEKAEQEKELSKADKVAIYAQEYAPCAVMTAASLVCIFGSNSINKKRIASLAGAYILSETTLKDYKEKVEEVAGSKKAQEIREKVLEKHINENPPTDANVVQANNSMKKYQLVPWYDETTRRYFMSNADVIRKAENEANKLLQKNKWVSLNDVYDLLGVDIIPIGEEIGWDAEMCDEISIEIGAVLMDEVNPIGTIKMDVRPSSAWLSVG